MIQLKSHTIMFKFNMLIISVTALATFFLSYFYDLTLNNINQYLGLIASIWIDAFFGTIAGIKREGFKTRKFLLVLQRTVSWIIFLTVILMIEKGFIGSEWLSETITIPFMVLQLVSALKNAQVVGFIPSKELEKLLNNIDKHKEIIPKEDKENK